MANYNKVVLVGNLTRDPEMKTLASGTVRTKIVLAVSRIRHDDDGKKHEEVCFFTCLAFGKKAEVIGKYMKKGDPLLIDGHLNNWDHEDDSGTVRRMTEVVIDELQLLAKVGGGEAK